MDGPLRVTEDPGPASAMRLAVFGGVDGLTMFLGLVLGIVVSRQPGSAAWHAALGGGIGEMIGMTSGQYMSDRAAGFGVAVACGLAGMIACTAPGIPFAFLSRVPAMYAALAIALLVATAVAWMRPEKGFRAIAQTFGILILAGVLSGLTGLI